MAIPSGWIHQRQQQIIEFQNAQIESLLKTHGKKRMLRTGDRRRLYWAIEFMVATCPHASIWRRVTFRRRTSFA